MNTKRHRNGRADRETYGQIAHRQMNRWSGRQTGIQKDRQLTDGQTAHRWADSSQMGRQLKDGQIAHRWAGSSRMGRQLTYGQTAHGWAGKQLERQTVRKTDGWT